MKYESPNIPPTREERKIALEGYNTLNEALKELNHPENVPEIRIQESGEPIKIPFKVLEMLAFILKNYQEGNAVSIVPIGTEFTTQKAAEFLNCSRPYVVKLIEQGKLKCKKVGRHRRIKFKDLVDYKKKMIKEREEALDQMVKEAEEMGLYETDK